MHWRRDPAILARLPEVESRVLLGEPNTAIAQALGVDEATVRNDRKRLQELWLEQVGGRVEVLRASAVSELDAIKARALAAAEFDERMERAVLLGEPMGNRTCPGKVDHGEGAICAGPHLMELRVQRDDKGSATFRGNKSAALNVARQAVMDKAKVLGVIVEKVSPTDADGKTLDLASLMALARQSEPPVAP